MSNQWLNNLRRKMEDHTEDVPDGLWDDIRGELFEKDEENKVLGFALMDDKEEITEKSSGINLKHHLYRAVGIAAAIALLLFVGNLLFEKSQEYSNQIAHSEKNPKNKTEYSSLEKNDINENFLSEKDKHLSENILDQEYFIEHLNQTKREIERIDDLRVNYLKNRTMQGVVMWKQQVVPGDIILNPISSISGNDESQDPFTDNEEEQNKSKESKLGKKSGKSWMLSLLTGNTSSGSSAQFPGYATLNGAPMVTISNEFGTAGYQDTALNQLLLANQDEEIRATVRHKVPVTVGISIYRSLGKKWGLGTGVNYTRLASELYSGSESNYIKSDQSVHNIGIPVQINYNAVQKGKFTGYLTAGAMVEKTVAGNLTTKYIVNNELKEEKKESLESKPLQFSVNGGLGLQYKIIKNVGVYAEPGIDYHFKDDSSLNTIYKEKPLNFNMKFGVRVLID